MYNFKNDYCVVGHELILKKLQENINEVNNGYGLDKHSEKAADLIKKVLDNESVDVHFLVGGTSANKTVISHILKPYEAVIACDTGHIAVHETGAIEATGHKVIVVPNVGGKLTKENLLKVLHTHTDEHMVKPRLVYISNSTENGAVYYLDELQELYSVCKENGLYLFIDGARLGVALTSIINDVEMKNLPELCDVFYIGGTKNGAMLGEAVVVVNDKLKEGFRYSIKQNGGMYSKGFIAGMQFEALFEDNLYFELAKHANDCACLLRMGLEDLNVEFAFKSLTNQLFPIFPNEIIEQLEKIVTFEVWEKGETHSTIRFVTAFNTKEEDISDFIVELSNILYEYNQCNQ